MFGKLAIEKIVTISAYGLMYYRNNKILSLSLPLFFSIKLKRCIIF